MSNNRPLGREPSIFLLPKLLSGSTLKNDPSGFLELDKNHCLPNCQSAIIRANRLAHTDEISDVLRTSDLDIANAVRFSFVRTKAILDEYSSWAHQRSKIEDYNEFRKAKVGTDPYRAFLVRSIIFQDLDKFACLAAVANFLSAGPMFCTHYLQNNSNANAIKPYRFQLFTEVNRKGYDDFGIERMSVSKTFALMLYAFEEAEEEEFTQFTRGLSYFISGATKSTDYIGTIVWNVSTIEALLAKRSEKLGQDVLIDRLKAVLGGSKTDFIVSQFRKLYKHRNRFLHGNLDLPIWFGGANRFPDRNVDHIEWPSQEANAARLIAIRLLQEYIKAGIVKAEFRTSLKVSKP